MLRYSFAFRSLGGQCLRAYSRGMIGLAIGFLLAFWKDIAFVVLGMVAARIVLGLLGDD